MIRWLRCDTNDAHIAEALGSVTRIGCPRAEGPRQDSQRLSCD